MGHDVIIENLYEAKFDPILSIREREMYYHHYDTSETV